MGLQQRRKRKRIRVQFPEWILILMTAITVVGGGVCLLGMPVGHWEQATGHITGLRGAATALNSEQSIDTSSLHLQFEYTVDGVVYNGEKTLGRMSQLVMGVLPQRVRERLASQGVLTFSDIPEEIQVVLKRKGMTSLDKVPVALLQEAALYEDESALPDELKVAAREKDYAALAQALDAAVPDAVAGKPVAMTEDPTPMESLASFTKLIAGGEQGNVEGVPGRVYLFYNPEHPAQYKVRMLGMGSGLLGLVVLVLGTIATLSYGAFRYPKLKRR